jgi:hypothetical protein
LAPGIDGAEPVDVAVEQEHLGLHADRDGGGVQAGDAGADHDDLGRVDSGDSAHQDAAAARGLHHGRRADLRGEPPGHLGHRGQQGQRAVRRLHGLIGDAGDLTGHELLGEALVGG